MGIAITDRLTRGSLGTSPFALAYEEDLKISFITVNSIADRDNLPEWRRLPYMTVRVIADNSYYTLGSDTTIVGQSWTLDSFGVPSDVLVEGDILDVNGLIKSELIGNIFLNESYVVDSEAAMLALTTVTGNFIIRTDTSSVYVKLNNDDPAAVDDFAELTFPGAVLSVNGNVGAVSVTIANLLAVAQNTTDFNAAVAAAPAVADLTSSYLTVVGDIAGLEASKADLTYVDSRVLGDTLTDPGADAFMSWVDSAGEVRWLKLGTGFEVTGDTVAAIGSGSAINALVDLQDVAITGPTTGQALIYDGSFWTNQTIIGGGGGHVIQNAGTPLTQRANLNFSNGLTASDNNPTTDVKLGGALLENTTFTGDFDVNYTGNSLFGFGQSTSGSNTLAVRSVFIGTGNNITGAYGSTSNLVVGTSNSILQLNGGLVVGANNTLTWSQSGLAYWYSLVVGGDNSITGINAFIHNGIFGSNHSITSLTYAHAFTTGYNHTINGSSAQFSTVFGSGGSTNNVATLVHAYLESGGNKVLASGTHAVNISTNTSAQTAGHGALSNDSVIIGGRDHNIPADSLRVGIVGGNAIKARAASSDIVYVPALNLVGITGDYSTPGDGDIWYNTTSDEFRVRANGLTSTLITDTLGDTRYWKTTGTFTTTGVTEILGTGSNELYFGTTSTRQFYIEFNVTNGIYFKGPNNSQFNVNLSGATPNINLSAGGSSIALGSNNISIGNSVAFLSQNGSTSLQLGANGLTNGVEIKGRTAGFVDRTVLRLSESSALFIDSRATAVGLQYNADYSANYTSRSLIDKGYADATYALAGSGYTNLTQFVNQTAWRLFYSNASGDVVELALGANGTYLKATGATSAPIWDTPGGGGDVVGPASAVNNNVVFFDGVTGKLIKDSGLTLSGSNTGDQTSIVGITGTKAQFDTAVTDGNFMYIGDAPTAHTLDSHSNVTITSNSDGEILRWNGSAWVNNTLAEASILTAATNSTQEGYFTGVRLLETVGSTFYLRLVAGSDLSANRTFTITTGDGDRTLSLAGNLTTTGAFNTTFAVSGSNTITFPNASITVARTDAAQTFTGVQTMTSPSFTTSVVTASTSFLAWNTTATTFSMAGAATTFTVGGTPTTAVTANFFTNATATATTKTLNIGTGGAAGSTTNVNIGSSTTSAILGTLSLNFPTILTAANNTTVSLWDTNSTTINFAGAATTLTIGATTGTMNLRNATIVLTQTPADDVGFATSNLLVRDSSGNLDKLTASGGGTSNFLRADGTWAAPAGGSSTGSSGELQASNGSGGFISSELIGSSGSLQLGLTTTAGASRSIFAEGSNANVSLTLYTKGTGSITLDPGFAGGTGSTINLNGVANATSLGHQLSLSSTTFNAIHYSNSQTSVPRFNFWHQTQQAVALVGMGVGLEFTVETASNNHEIGAAIEVISTNVTSTTEAFDLVFRTMDAGAAASESMRLNYNSTVQTLSLGAGKGTSSVFIDAAGTGANVSMSVRSKGSSAVNLIAVGAGSATVQSVSGLVTLSAGTDVQINPTSNLALLGNNSTWNTGAKIMHVANASTAPTGNPTGGAYFWVDPSTQLPKWRVPGGTVYTLTDTGAGGLSDGDYGDVTVSSAGTVITVDADIAKTWTGIHSFQNNKLRLYNPANTFYYEVTTTALAANRNITLPLLTGADTFLFEAFAATLTNKTINLTSNTLSGTKAQFDAALSDGNFLYVGDVVGVSDGDKGDITVSASGATWTVDANLNKTWTGIHEFTTSQVVMSLEDAVSNTVLYPFRLRRTSSVAPANNIGVGIEFEVETAAGNNEVGMSISAVAWDTISTAEDFDLNVSLMAGGTLRPALLLRQLEADFWNLTGTFYTRLAFTAPTANRVFTFPNVANDTVALIAASQTFTNKTLTSPVINTQVTTGSASITLWNSTATTVNFAGAATTFTIGGTPSTALTASIFANPTAAATTKTINLGTAGVSTSITDINIGSAVSGALGTTIIGGATFRLLNTPATDADFSTSQLLVRDSSGNVDVIAASGGGTTNFLRADGTWAAAGGGVSDGDKGDITVSASGATWTIDTDIVKTWTGAHTFSALTTTAVDSATNGVAVEHIRQTASFTSGNPSNGFGIRNTFYLEPTSGGTPVEMGNYTFQHSTSIGSSSYILQLSSSTTTSSLFNFITASSSNFYVTFPSVLSGITTGIIKFDITGSMAGTSVVPVHVLNATANFTGAGSYRLFESTVVETAVGTTSPFLFHLTAGGSLRYAYSHLLKAATGNEVIFNMSATVNKATSGNYTGILLNVTETSAPGTDDRLLDLQVGGSSRFYVSNDGLLNFIDGVRQIFNPNGTNAGLNVGAHTTDPSAPVNGDIYYDSTNNLLRARINGAWVSLGAGGSFDEAGTYDMTGSFTLRDNVLKVRNPANTFSYSVRTSAIAAARDITLPLLTTNDVFVFEAFAQTLTNKTINLTNNTLSGTKAQFDTALSDDNFAYVGTANSWGAFNQNISSGGKWQEGGVAISPIGKHDIWVGAGSMWVTTTSGAAVLTKTEHATSLLNTQGMAFDPSTIEYAQFTIVLPRNWNPSSTITFVVHWMVTGGGAGDVVWGLRGGAWSDGDLTTTSNWGTEVTVTDTKQTGIMTSPRSTALTLGGSPAAGETLQMEIRRVATSGSDTFGGDAVLLGVSIEVQTNAAVAAT